MGTPYVPAPASPYLVPFDGTFSIPEAPTTPPDDGESKKTRRRALKQIVKELAKLQDVLYAADHRSLLLVFQAMDAAGKDSTIRAVTTGVNPAGFQVFSFKQPSQEELDHDFLWRTSVRLPERGRIGIFNRSYYEEVLVVRVHPEYLRAQRVWPDEIDTAFWEARYESIREHEEHLASNGTVILKFWLNVSKEQQARRFLRRMDRPDKNWKFSSSDVAERRHWEAYMEAYEAMLNATSRPWAPWYAIPADDKPFMRLEVGRIVRDQLRTLNLDYPVLPDDERARLFQHRDELVEGS